METIELGTLYKRDTYENVGEVTISLEDEFCIINFPKEYEILSISVPTDSLAELVREAIAQNIVLLRGSE